MNTRANIDLAAKMRQLAVDLRVKPIKLSTLIPLLQQAADALAPTPVAKADPVVGATGQIAGCNRGNRCPWSDERSDGRSYCRACGLRSSGSGQ